MSFTIAIIGRPNVGKSTLFNRLAGRKLALVDDTPGVTRDRRVHPAKLYDLAFDVIDTAGFEDAPAASLPGRMRAQTEIAIREADLIFFVVDAKTGLVPDDRTFAEIVRRSDKLKNGSYRVYISRAHGENGHWYVRRKSRFEALNDSTTIDVTDHYRNFACLG